MEGFPHSHIEVEISQPKFRLFHTMDRILYMILVKDLLCDPMDAMKIMAIWLWLERVGFHNTIKRILRLPIPLIDELVGEAIVCLNFINNSLSNVANELGDIHLTQSLIQDFSLQYLRENQTLAKFQVETVRTNICMQAFSDLAQQAISQIEAHRIFRSQQIFMQQSILSIGSSNGVVPSDQRTMFATFSKGYPVEEWEIHDFLIKKFGDCIESIEMEDVRGTREQPLFARIVFFRVDTIHIILNGLSKAKFNVNGKHVWMRKFVPRDQEYNNATTHQR